MSSNYANYGIAPTKYKCCHSKSDDHIQFGEINFDKLLSESSYRYVEWEIDLKWESKYEIE
jgi:hypothetical protein